MFHTKYLQASENPGNFSNLTLEMRSQKEMSMKCIKAYSPNKGRAQIIASMSASKAANRPVLTRCSCDFSPAQLE